MLKCVHYRHMHNRNSSIIHYKVLHYHTTIQDLQDMLLTKINKKLSSKIYLIDMYLEKMNTFKFMNINEY